MEHLVGPLRPCPCPCPRLLGLRFERGFAHAHDAVDLASLLHQQPFCHDVTMHHTGGLDLDALVGANATAHFPADNGFARDHIAFHLAALPHHHLPATTHATPPRPSPLPSTPPPHI